MRIEEEKNRHGERSKQFNNGCDTENDRELIRLRMSNHFTFLREKISRKKNTEEEK